ncbi:importin subunit alpha-2 [Trifolium repens]|nr:importin subunit alpha-2 [Trifolium repens]
MGDWVSSDDKSQLLKTTIQFEKLQKLLSIEKSPLADKLIETIIQPDVVPSSVEFLAMDHRPQLQWKAAWLLAYIASGTSKHTKAVIDHGAVPIFVKLLSSPSHHARENAAWALGNIAADSPSCRDLVLSHGALIPLLSHFNDQSNLRNTMWTLLNFLGGNPQPPFEQVRPALPAIQHLLFSNDERVLADTCRALSFLSYGPPKDKIQAVIDAGVCARLVQLLLHPSPSVLLPALHTVGNIVTGGDMQTQVVINHGLLPCLLSLLTHNHDKNIQIEACWTIANITSGNTEQIQAVIEAGLIASLVNLFQNAEFDIKKEAAWAFYNASSGGTNDQIKYLVSQEGLDNFLKVGKAEKSFGNMRDDVNLYARMINDAEGLVKIEYLQSHDNNEISEKAVKILKTYYLLEDEEIRI